ncbi:hypothetical protein [Citreimonas salinaria]|nr:hypothetical protein [Citreimonas salinaria]
MAYQSPPPPHPTGLYWEKVERIRHQRGLDDRGFPIKRNPEEDTKQDEPG